MSREMTSLPDGGLIKIEGKRWDLCLPSGKHVRGTAPTIAEAEQAALARYKNWVFARWMNGESVGRGRFMCSLK